MTDDLKTVGSSEPSKEVTGPTGADDKVGKLIAGAAAGALFGSLLGPTGPVIAAVVGAFLASTSNSNGGGPKK